MSDDDHEHTTREEFQHDPIGYSEVRAGIIVRELIDEYGKAGIGAADLNETVDVVAEMFADDTTVFFGLARARHTGGLRLRCPANDGPPQTGATLDEARSWGKLEKDARNVSLYADATITLPLVVAGALDRIT